MANGAATVCSVEFLTCPDDVTLSIGGRFTVVIFFCTSTRTMFPEEDDQD